MKHWIIYYIKLIDYKFIGWDRTAPRPERPR
jgi:hypothetical protein